MATLLLILVWSAAVATPVVVYILLADGKWTGAWLAVLPLIAGFIHVKVFADLSTLWTLEFWISVAVGLALPLTLIAILIGPLRFRFRAKARTNGNF